MEAAWERGIRTVDTTNGISYPVAEWTLALILVSLRNAGAYFRRIIAGDTDFSRNDDPGYLRGDLTGKRVELIGCGHIGRRLIQFLPDAPVRKATLALCGHIGRRLIQFLRPFEADIRAASPDLGTAGTTKMRSTPYLSATGFRYGWLPIMVISPPKPLAIILAANS